MFPVHGHDRSAVLEADWSKVRERWERCSSSLASVIVVGGEALVDLVIDTEGRVVAKLGGGPFNSARAAARLGSPVAFLGSLSRDRFRLDFTDRIRGYAPEVPRFGHEVAAALDATRETALPRLLAMLCILAVFLPAFFMQGAARALFAYWTALPRAPESAIMKIELNDF